MRQINGVKTNAGLRNLPRGKSLQLTPQTQIIKLQKRFHRPDQTLKGNERKGNKTVLCYPAGKGFDLGLLKRRECETRGSKNENFVFLTLGATALHSRKAKQPVGVFRSPFHCQF